MVFNFYLLNMWQLLLLNSISISETTVITGNKGTVCFSKTQKTPSVSLYLCSKLISSLFPRGEVSKTVVVLPNSSLCPTKASWASVSPVNNLLSKYNNFSFSFSNKVNKGAPQQPLLNQDHKMFHSWHPKYMTSSLNWRICLSFITFSWHYFSYYMNG